MFDRELMILGLRKQQSLLSELIENLEAKPRFDIHDHDMYDERTREITLNLKKLRQIKKDYLAFRN